ncbi:WecB/TagA/CpsF family glycosyltransferase [Saccharophagus degradans]|uniref:B-glycosyltransferase-like protein n=1 Tax=Saccharophagus degradans (strain 2-40 / ATCC 43961 / DSM 17024) TaxID=203122 RepID=Q21E26_SACD2|nr:WecB/TagA/CpsF family glycosyltransferase [Saccharophagus degradans]ABD83053.1 b-glycosyltransferase-like protein [Saccharophagus degradans 2-40]
MQILSLQRQKFYPFSVVLVDKILALTVLALLLPVHALNTLLAIFQRKAFTRSELKQDALGRVVELTRWNVGLLRESLHLLNVVKNEISLAGVSLKYVCIEEDILTLTPLKPGLFSIYEIQHTIGRIDCSHGDTLRQHERNITVRFQLAIVIKAIVCRVLYQSNKAREASRFNVLGVHVDNWLLADVLNWIFTDTNIDTNTNTNINAKGNCRSGYFINVNSINLAYSDGDFKKVLASADCALADGSGVRLGAKRLGVQLRDNVNGTDLLPHICRRAIAEGWSIYLLGSEKGVAAATAKNLKATFTGLRIAGTHHGFVSEQDDELLVQQINQSGADIVLVAMGSPMQEKWIARNKVNLQASTALAVGGLFDFYSGKIPRAPVWMRELGMEWIYRLAMEPKAKFNRYVIGNPLFMWRIMNAKT